MNMTDVYVIGGAKQIVISSSDWSFKSRFVEFAELVEKGDLKLEVHKSEDSRSVSLHFKAVSKEGQK